MIAASTVPNANPSIVRGPVFRSVVCGVDGTRAGHEAVRQAAMLASPGAELELVAVTPLAGHPQFLPLPDAACEALADARLEVLALGCDATVRAVPAASAAEGLLRAGADRDLIVIGSNEITTPLGVALGRVTRAAVADAPRSVLVARRPPTGEFAGSILVAVDGTEPAHRATLYGARIARETGADIALVAAPERDSGHVRALAEDVAVVAAVTGAEPIVLDEYGPAARAIVASAARIDASMIVLGTRATAAGDPSVSEEVARTAGCSVLIVREP